jgi:hypothetical protein
VGEIGQERNALLVCWMWKDRGEMMPTPKTNSRKPKKLCIRHFIFDVNKFENSWGVDLIVTKARYDESNGITAKDTQQLIPWLNQFIKWSRVKGRMNG